MFIPGTRILTFFPPESNKRNKRRGKNLLFYLFCSLKFYKIENYFIFEHVKKKIWANSLRTGQKATGSRIQIRNTARNIKSHFNLNPSTGTKTQALSWRVAPQPSCPQAQLRPKADRVLTHNWLIMILSIYYFKYAPFVFFFSKGMNELRKPWRFCR